MAEISLVSSSKCFEGSQRVYEHQSAELGCKMKFSIFLPSAAEADSSLRLPVVYYLSGLTCTEQNVITKCGFQQYAERYNLIVVGPDTSPRGCNVPGEDDSWDVGTGAGFYVDATEEPWSKHYRMSSYVTKELPALIDKNFKNVDSAKVGITGHSMGGHGALVAFFKNPKLYKAASAFAPISNPTNSAWGKKCFQAYLGANQESWKEYDATELVKRQPRRDIKILVEQGSRDEWMSYLVPGNFLKACKAAGQPIEYTEREGYDHGYYFVSTFIERHMKFFSDTLRQQSPQ